MCYVITYVNIIEETCYLTLSLFLTLLWDDFGGLNFLNGHWFSDFLKNGFSFIWVKEFGVVWNGFTFHFQGSAEILNGFWNKEHKAEEERERGRAGLNFYGFPNPNPKS